MDEHQQQITRGWHAIWFIVSRCENYLARREYRRGDYVLDVRMPGMGGIELHRQLVAGHYEIPVILITAHEDDGMQARALSGGVGAVLFKPFSEEAILSAIHSAVIAQ